MKKILLFLFLMLLAIPEAMTEEIVKEFSLHYDLKNFIVKEKGDLVAVKPKMFKYENLFMGFNQPELPWFLCKPYISGNSYADFDIECEVKHSDREVFLENVDIATMLPLNSEGQYVEELIKYDRFDEDDINPVSSECRDGKVLVWVKPFVYDTETRTVYFIKDIDITVRIKEKEKKFIQSGSSSDQIKTDIIPDNPDIDLLLGYNNSNLDISEEILFPMGIDYLIITSNTLKETYQPLLDWKKHKGLKVKLMTVDEIDTEYEGSTIQEKIKKCIEYNRRSNGLNYVLLGGNKTVPSQGCYGRVKIGMGG